MAPTTPACAIEFFITMLLTSTGFDVKEALLLTTPPYVAAAVSCFFFAWLADKTKPSSP
ncbi:hypothetical protein D9611_002136 [Ephemerocybe angulata]|uniref:Uncharacterized protein n=1 Tax=Ephemerocybe angulata TaxID=980116 RepID=A0A8H5CI77_9AGAR|nr:hypothetical protein D9611_002136 [Tulosesus angulatus]